MTGITVFYLLLAFVGTLALALIPYFFRQKSKRPKNWIGLALLRFIALFGTAILLINPKIETTDYSIEKKRLVLAVDNSASIQDLQADSTVKRLVQQFKGNSKLNERFSIEAFSFGNKFQQLDSLNFDEKQTNLSQISSNLKQLYRGQETPLILISDGNQTLGADYEYEFKSLNSDIFPVVVGDTTQYPDYKIDQLNVNQYAFLDNKFPVEIFVNRNQNDAAQKSIDIKKGNRTVFSKSLDFDENQRSAVVKAILSANSVGVQTYQVEIEASAEEKNIKNNTRRFAIEVIDEQTKVLIASSFLHPDLGSFKKSIESNKQRQAEIKLVKNLNIDQLDLGKYQLIIRYQPTRGFKKLDDQIKKLGLNTFSIQGLQTDYTYENNRQDWYQKEISNQEEDYFPVLNSGYNAFQINEFNFDNFPPLKDQFGSITFKGKNQVMLFQKVNGIETETPLLATHEINKRRDAVLFGENSWRWRAESFRKEGNFESYDEFFGKITQYLASDKSRNRLTLDYKSFYNSGEKIILRARYFDKNYQFDPRANLYIQTQNKETSEKKRIPFVLKNKRYEVDLSNFEAGEYKFTVGVKNEQLNKSGSFTILDFEVEKQFSNANQKKMAAIASEKLFFPDEIKTLIKNLIESEKYRPVQKANTKKAPLIDWIHLLFIIIGALAFEWFIRKYNGLT